MSTKIDAETVIGSGPKAAVVIHPHNPYVPTAHANVRFTVPNWRALSPYGGLAAGSA
jgi:coproporphyrinogen III oxidase